MAKKQKPERYLPMELNLTDLRTRLALLKLGKFDMAFLKAKPPRRPH
jgi:hypothetical protein